jgi:hypothetical protein
MCMEFGTFEDTNEIIKSHKSKDRQYNGQKKKGQTMIYKTLHIKLKIAQHEPIKNRKC